MKEKGLVSEEMSGLFPMSNLASHQPHDFPILAENYQLIGIWVCWLSGSPALANYHAMQLRGFYSD